MTDVQTLIAERWSPFFFERRPIEEEKLDILFESLSRSPSCYNDQPWHFVLGLAGDEGHERIYRTLVEFNQKWAHTAPLLGVSVAELTSGRTGERNPYAHHDIGLAMGHLIVQASDLGLSIRMMGGIDLEEARRVLSIPEGYEPVSAFAIGYAGEPPEGSDPHVVMRHQERRARKSPSDFVFSNQWGE